MASEDDRSIRDTWLGFGLCLVLHLLQIPMMKFSQGVTLWGIGISQVVYVLPAILIAKSKGRMGIVKGLIIGASVTFLLNAACFGFLIVGLSGYPRR